MTAPAPPRRRRSAPSPDAAAPADAWTTAPAVWSEEFVPADTGLDALDSLRVPHRRAVRALHAAQAATREQATAYDAEDNDYREAIAEDLEDLPDLTAAHERDLTLQVLRAQTKAARERVIASAQEVMAAVADSADDWRALLDTRATIAADAKREAAQVLRAAWEREHRITRLGTWLTRVAQGQPATFLSGSILDAPAPDQPRDAYVPETLLTGGGTYGV